MKRPTQGSAAEKNFVLANYIGCLADALPRWESEEETVETLAAFEEESDFGFEMLREMMRDEGTIGFYRRFIAPYDDAFKIVAITQKDPMARREEMAGIVFPRFAVSPDVRRHWESQIEQERQMDAVEAARHRQA